MSELNPYDYEAKTKRDKQKKKTADVERHSDEEDFKWLMGIKRGRRLVWRLLEQSGVFQSSFNSNSMTMAFNEGRRNYGLKTLSDIHSNCPELYHTMVKEQKCQKH